jgi:integrase
MLRDVSTNLPAENVPRALNLSNLYKVRICKAATGEEIPLLVDATLGLPVVRANQYALVARRDRCQASTLRAELGILAIVLAWARRRGLDLDEALERALGFSQAELVSLVDALRTDYRNRNQERGVIPLRRPLVSSEVWANRIATARDYFAWSLAAVLSRCEPGTLRYQHVRERREEIHRAMTGRIPKTRSTSMRKGLEPHLKQRLFDVVRPGSAENPFQRALQERNALIVDVLQTIGLRRAELCKLRTADIRFGPRPELVVERLPDDREDPRRNQPQVKTNGRVLPLSAHLAARLQSYIVNDRRNLPNAKRTPFLFLARKGDPIAMDTVNNIFDQLAIQHPEFAGLLTPHVLRHTANDELSETLEKAGCSAAEIAEIRNYLNGWQPNSSQGLAYNRRYIEAKAAEVSLAHQRRIFGEDRV